MTAAAVDNMTQFMQKPLDNSYWVLPQLLLAGEYPGGTNETDTRARLALLDRAGINSFIDLTETGERIPYRQHLKPDCDYLRAAIIDAQVPNNVSDTRLVLAAIHNNLNRGRRTYVHCRAGIGRTGLIIGCYLAEIESSGSAGLRTLNRLWTQSARAKSWPKLPQTAEQADYIRKWPKLAKQFA